MSELLCICVMMFVFVLFMFNHLIGCYKDRVAFLEDELRDYQDFIWKLLKGEGD